MASLHNYHIMDALQTEHFKCPISHQIFGDPVMAKDGFIYERTCIEEWLSQYDYSPQTKEKISKELFPSRTMKSMVHELLAKHEELREDQFTPTYSFTKNIQMVNNIVTTKDFRRLLSIVEFTFNYTKIDNVGIFTRVLSQCTDNDILYHIIDNCDNVTDSTGETLFHYVCRYLPVEFVQYMVQKGANTESASSRGERPIHYVCRNKNHPEVVKYLVDLGVELECMTDDEARPIHYACECSSLAMIKYLVSKGVDTSCTTKKGVTPIQLACRFFTMEELLAK